MSLRRLVEGLSSSDSAQQAGPFPIGNQAPGVSVQQETTPYSGPLPSKNGHNGQNAKVMPAGPGVDVSTVLKPLIDGSYSQAQGQAAMMATAPASHVGTVPLPQTNNLSAPSQAPGVAASPAVTGKLIANSASGALQAPPLLVQALVQRMLAGFPANVQLDRTAEIEQMLAGRFMAAISHVPGTIPAGGQELLFNAVMDEILGFGPLEPLLKDDSISEIMVNGPNQVWVERKGQLVESGVTFQNDDHVMRVAQRIVAPLGRRIDRKWPMVDARLPDGSRVNIIIQPCALQGTTITIRKFFKSPLTVDNLIKFGTLTQPMADFLRACVIGRLNVVVSGGTGSGKTTLLNVLSSFIPEGERIVTIEDSAELRLNQRHVVSLEARPSDADGANAVTIRNLVVNALRMRPERIVVGEVRSGEALDMLQAMNTGHDGSLTTLHANTPRDALTRLETMVLMSGMDLPVRVIREQVASAIDLIVQQARLRDGSRKIIYITEVQGMEGDTIVLQDIFRFRESGTDSEGKVMGKLQASGLVPKFITRLENHGQTIDRSLFS